MSPDDPETEAAMQFMLVLQNDTELARRLCVFLEARRQEIIARINAETFDAKFLKQLHIAGE